MNTCWRGDGGGRRSVLADEMLVLCLIVLLLHVDIPTEPVLFGFALLDDSGMIERDSVGAITII